MDVWNLSESRSVSKKVITRAVNRMVISLVGSKVACIYSISWGDATEVGVIFDIQLDTFVNFTFGDGKVICFDGTGERLAITDELQIVIVDAANAEVQFIIDCTKGYQGPSEFCAVWNIFWDASTNHIIATMCDHWAIIDAESGDVLELHEGMFLNCHVHTAQHGSVLM